MDKKQELEKLRAGYTRYIRAFELISIGINLVLSCYLLGAYPLSIWSYIVLLVMTWLLADIISGFVHWFADTFGKVDWPIIGNTFIRSFHEHHLDPKSITRHDWIETNGNNFFIGIPVLLLVLLFENEISAQVVVGICLLNIWTSLTNQFHKWAHQNQVPQIVDRLQAWRVITQKSEHLVHHRYPHDRSYNITHGRLNPLLDRIGFFRGLEILGEKVLRFRNNRHI
ncbi:MAG: hypothetical protein CME65_16040 [Halobacteriovoraceae bacterium]|nr:hypothetical protein [Halobacteriovoraceae bacterium]|tara:strand:+ start:30857 stop:31534 length:678 start_codon:yes stop_codon:yes gene_type:complete